MPRSTNVVFSDALQKRHAKLGARIAPVACVPVGTDEIESIVIVFLMSNPRQTGNERTANLHVPPETPCTGRGLASLSRRTTLIPVRRLRAGSPDVPHAVDLWIGSRVSPKIPHIGYVLIDTIGRAFPTV